MSDDPAAQGLAEGTLLAGRYRILRKLGEGAMGDVFLAEHIQIRRHDAIKVLRPSLASDPDAVARFLRGAQSISTIRHPNVCAIYDFTETEDGLRFLAMEYVDGPTLREVLAREGRLSPERAIAIAVQIADALQAAHDAGIVHRDLKPGNVMLRPKRRGREVVKVVDFDIAKAAEGGDEVTRLGFVVGTPEYMSPEQLAGEPLDGRSDLYSLGLLLFRMLTGTLPFRAEGPQDLMVARLTSSPIKLADELPGASFPDQIQPALDRALQRRASDRQADAAEFAREIQAVSGWAPPVVRPTPSSDVPPTRVTEAPSSGSGAKSGISTGHNGWLFGSVGALAAAAVVAVILLLPPDTDGDDPPEFPRLDPEVATNRADSDPGVADGQTIAQPPGEREAPEAQRTSDSGGGPNDVVERAVPDREADNDTRTTEVLTDMPQRSTQIQFESAEAIEELLLRLQPELVDPMVPPGAERLAGIRDTLEAVVDHAYSDGPRRVAARFLAYVEMYSGNRDGCLAWRDRVESLRPGTADLDELCGPERP